MVGIGQVLFFSPDPRDFLAWSPTPSLGLGGWELVWPTFSELFSELFSDFSHPKAWFGRVAACLVNLAKAAKPRTAVNRATESDIWQFPSHHQGIRFSLSGNVFTPHHSAHFSPEGFLIFAPRWRLVLLRTSRKTNTRTTMGKLTKHFPATL